MIRRLVLFALAAPLASAACTSLKPDPSKGERNRRTQSAQGPVAPTDGNPMWYTRTLATEPTAKIPDGINPVVTQELAFPAVEGRPLVLADDSLLVRSPRELFWLKDGQILNQWA